MAITLRIRTEISWMKHRSAEAAANQRKTKQSLKPLLIFDAFGGAFVPSVFPAGWVPARS